LGKNTELYSRNYYTVISNGAAGDRECNNKQGKWNWTDEKSKGYNVFWKLGQCDVVKARSKNKTGFASGGGFEVYWKNKWGVP